MNNNDHWFLKWGLGMGIPASWAFAFFVFSFGASNSISPTILNQSRWEKAFTNIIKEEGGYVNSKKDPGGETNWGISKTSYPHINIKTLTKEQAEDIYRKDFWMVMRGDEFPNDDLAIEVMEESVNMGTVVAIRFLQTALCVCGQKVEIDGKLGTQTLKAIHNVEPSILLACVKSQSMSYYMSLVHHTPGLRKFLKGWFNRVLN